MTTVQQRTTRRPDRRETQHGAARDSALLAHGAGGLEKGTVVAMLVAMSVLALLGLRYPQRMLPILLFEVAWKLRRTVALTWGR
jgi:hypothetical protein